ncbi:hypothetical protein LJC23_07660, partial [Desulfovibrio sp. OttesenSCG-928-I05]|nr:hypothetical protein [Desulfovibrio sp. OttesenSCG-928-I05]
KAQEEGRLNPGITPVLVLTSTVSVIMLPLASRGFFDKIPVLPPLEKDMLRQHALSLILDGICGNGSTEGQP